MDNDGFLEVETPMLHSIYGGATAEPFKTHHNTLDHDMYLRIAPELYLKRTLVSGLTDRVFEMNRNFRNEGVSTRHNPEFTMIEATGPMPTTRMSWTWSSGCSATLVEMLHGSTTLRYAEQDISLCGPVRAVADAEAVKDKTGIDFLAIDSDEEARAAAKALGFEVEPTFSWGETLAHLFEETVEGTPYPADTCHDFPKDISPFAKEVPGEPRLVERFETYCNAWEMGNAFSELNDPEEQRRRMVEQLEQAHARGESRTPAGQGFSRGDRPRHADGRWTWHRGRPVDHAPDQCDSRSATSSFSPRSRHRSASTMADLVEHECTSGTGKWVNGSWRQRRRNQPLLLRPRPATSADDAAPM